MGIQQMLLSGGGNSATANVVNSIGNFVVSSFTPSAPNFPRSPADGPLSNTTGTTSGDDFTLQADGGYAGGQNGAFLTITVGLTAGGTRTYTAAAATWNASLLIWTWGTGASPVWTAAGAYSFTFS